MVKFGSICACIAGVSLVVLLSACDSTEPASTSSEDLEKITNSLVNRQAELLSSSFISQINEAVLKNDSTLLPNNLATASDENGDASFMQLDTSNFKLLQSDVMCAYNWLKNYYTLIIPFEDTDGKLYNFVWQVYDNNSLNNFKILTSVDNLMSNLSEPGLIVTSTQAYSEAPQDMLGTDIVIETTSDTAVITTSEWVSVPSPYEFTEDTSYTSLSDVEGEIYWLPEDLATMTSTSDTPVDTLESFNPQDYGIASDTTTSPDYVNTDSELDTTIPATEVPDNAE